MPDSDWPPRAKPLDVLIGTAVLGLLAAGLIYAGSWLIVTGWEVLNDPLTASTRHTRHSTSRDAAGWFLGGGGLCIILGGLAAITVIRTIVRSIFRQPLIQDGDFSAPPPPDRFREDHEYRADPYDSDSLL